MKTIDDEFTDAALAWMDKQAKASKPFFCYYNSTRMHVFTHLKKESEGKTGLGLYPDGMVEHDGHVGQLLKKLDDLGIADNTIVVYTTDNGAEVFTWPDGGTTPFKGEKATGWEGAFRVPTLIRWPGVIKPGQVINDVCAHEDLIPTFAAAAGEPDLVAKVMKGYQANGKTFKVHLDGYNLMPFLKGEVKESPRKEFIYWSDDGDLMAIRYEKWKAAFFEQHTEISPKTPVGVWQGQFTKLRLPNLYNLRSDPFERGPTSIYYGDWMAHRAFIQVPMQGFAAKWLESFKEFPPRQKPASFNLDEVMRKMSEPRRQGLAAGLQLIRIILVEVQAQTTMKTKLTYPRAWLRAVRNLNRLCIRAGESYACRFAWLDQHGDGQDPLRRLRVQERLSHARSGRRAARSAQVQPRHRGLSHPDAGRRHHRIAAGHPRLRREAFQSGRHLGIAHGRRRRFVLTANTETVYGMGFLDSEERRPDRGGSAAENARRRDGYASALSSWTSARSARTRARVASTCFSRRATRARCRKVTSSSSHRPTALTYFVRGFKVDGKTDQAVALMKQIKVYPLREGG